MKPVFEFKEDDLQFKELLQEKFPEVEFSRVRGFDANTFVFVALIPLLSLTVEIADFIMSHMVSQAGKERKVIIDGESVTLENYSRNDVIKIIKALNE